MLGYPVGFAAVNFVCFFPGLLCWVLGLVSVGCFTYLSLLFLGLLACALVLDLVWDLIVVLGGVA